MLIKNIIQTPQVTACCNYDRMVAGQNHSAAARNNTLSRPYTCTDQHNGAQFALAQWNADTDGIFFYAKLQNFYLPVDQPIQGLHTASG